MMNERLPDELEAIERALRDRPQPSASLRCRVIQRVGDELHRSQQLAFWQYAAAVAASVLLVMNVGLSVARVPRTVIHDAPADTAALAEQVRRMELGLSEEEIERQCLLLAAGARLLPMARPYGSSPKTPLPF